MKKKKWIILIFILIIVYLGYNYIYQDHRNISKETAAYKLTATELMNQFQENPTTSQEKYLNKTIEITGNITAKDANSITLNNTIFCSLSNPTKIAIDATYTIKGRFIGFDDLLEEIKLDQCTIIN